MLIYTDNFIRLYLSLRHVSRIYKYTCTNEADDDDNSSGIILKNEQARERERKILFVHCILSVMKSYSDFDELS